jgi:hypothetical protein
VYRDLAWIAAITPSPPIRRTLGQVLDWEIGCEYLMGRSLYYLPMFYELMLLAQLHFSELRHA